MPNNSHSDDTRTQMSGKILPIDIPIDLVGKDLGDYKILKELGRGGMAVVYEAHQVSLDRNVAIKIIPQSLVEDPEYLERFKREASSAAGLSHPNIVSIHGFGQFGNMYYYVMDLAVGKTLDQFIEDKKHELLKKSKLFSSDDALKIIEQASSALAYAHKHGVIHRDIKPSNLILDAETGRTLITDFGLARSLKLEKITPKASLFGTPAYMSPEQATGKEVDARTDIYSLGAVLYEMLTATLPYTGANALEVIDKVKSEPITPPRKINPNIPLGVEFIILKAMSRDIKLRYHSMDELLRDIQNFKQGKSITEFIRIAQQKTKKIPINQSFKRIFIRLLIAAIIIIAVYFFGIHLAKKHRIQDADSKFQLAKNYEQIGMKDEAIKTYKEIILNYPDTTYAKMSSELLKKKN